MTDEHDGDTTNPDLGATDEHTNPGVGTGEAYVSVASSRDRALAAIRTLEDTCPPNGDAGRDRHLEVLAHAYGEAGDLFHDSRRVTLQLRREERKP